MPLRAALALLILLGACKSPFARYCETNADCTDPAYPTCDLTGASPAAGGHGRICVPSTADAGVPDADESLPPEIPSLLAPANGAFTGSVFTQRALRPAFRWRAVANASSYDLQVDETCPVVGFASCDLPSPEIDEAGLVGTEFQPGAPLEISSTAPVGRRYFWRVRACNIGGCSGWSAVRYLNVGRQASDFNGDGYGDRIIGIAPDEQAVEQFGKAYLYFGNATLATEPTITAADVSIVDADASALDGFGSVVASAGDVNGDGFGDFLVGGPGQRSGTGVAYLYLGRATWPASVSQESTLLDNTDSDVVGFGSVLAGGGDVNGDGFDDYLVGAPVMDETSNASSKVFLYFGRPSAPGFIVADVIFLPSLGNQGFGAATACGGDVNGDGLADVAIGHPFAGAGNAGAAFIYFGKTTWSSPQQAPEVRLDSPVTQPGLYAAAIDTRGDLNGDGLADLAIGHSTRANPEAAEGNAYLVFGRGSWTAPTAMDVEIDNPGDRILSRFGFSLSTAGDVDGDGLGDLVVGAPSGDDEGEVFAFLGREAWPSTVELADVSAANPGSTTTGRFGAAVSADGDMDGDGFDDIAAGAPQLTSAESRDGRVFLWFGRGVWPLGLSSEDTAIANPEGAAFTYFGHALQ